MARVCATGARAAGMAGGADKLSRAASWFHSVTTSLTCACCTALKFRVVAPALPTDRFRRGVLAIRSASLGGEYAAHPRRRAPRLIVIVSILLRVLTFISDLLFSLSSPLRRKPRAKPLTPVEIFFLRPGAPPAVL